MLGMEKNKTFVADDEPMTCRSCKEMEAPLAQYTVAVDTGKCIGCQMCTMDCAAHHADPKRWTCRVSALLGPPPGSETLRGCGRAMSAHLSLCLDIDG